MTIQEANAIGILDLDKARFKVVRSLGFKNHGLPRNALDASDEDGGINIRAWEHVFGMYQPDAIAPYTIEEGRRSHGEGCGERRHDNACGERAVRLITANEGDSRDWEYFSEESRVSDLSLDPDVFGADAGEDQNLGRLTVTTTLGDADADGEYEKLYAFGGRSMSVLNPSGRIAFDTRSFLERYTAGLGLEFFNLDNEAASDPDNRSDNKGPEPEGIVVGNVDGRQYAFLGLERQGGIVAFDLDATPGRPRFAGYINTRDDDLGPEGVDFVSAGGSPTGRPLVTFTNEIDRHSRDPPGGAERLRPTPRRARSARSRRRSGAGAHQFHLPSSSISEGTSSARMMVASISTASAVPSPFSLMKMISEVTKAPIAIENRSAAAVTIRPVRSRPIATASESLAPASRASLIRDSRNTP